MITERVNAGIAAARDSGARFGRHLVDPKMIAEGLSVAAQARANGHTAAAAAQLIGWSSATFYRHHQADAAQAAAVRTDPPA